MSLDASPHSKVPISSVEAVREGWRLTKDQYWTLLGVTLLGSLIGNALPVPVLLGPMMCGIHLAYLEKIDGRRTQFETLFRGFDHFFPSLVATVVIGLALALVGILFALVALALTLPLLSAAQGDLAAAAPTLIVVYVCLYVLCALVWINVYFFLMLAFVLIPDRGLSGLESLRVSSMAVWTNLGAFIGLAMLASAIPAGLCVIVYAIAGLIFDWGLTALIATTGICSVLALFSLPPLFGAITFAYRKVFPAAGVSGSV